MTGRKIIATRKPLRFGVAFTGFAIVVAVIAAAAILGIAEPAGACFPGIPC